MPHPLVLLLALAAPASPAQDDSLRATLERELDALRDEHGYPGFAALVIREGREDLVVCRGLARRGGDAVTPETLFQIGSITKMPVGLLAARLHAEGRFDLEGTLAEAFPDLELSPEVAAITMRQIASHTAGLPSYPANLDRVDGDPIRGYEEELLEAALRDLELAFPPGTSWSYSNLGYGVLGTALERKTGTPLPALLRAEVLAPLDVEDVALELDPALELRLSTPYRDDDPTVETEPWLFGALRGAGGAYASIRGLARLARVEMAAPDELPPPLARALVDAQRLHWSFEAGPPNGYGLGRFVLESERAGTFLSWHGGDVDGYAGTLLVAPRRRVAVAVLTNCGIGPPVGELGFRLLVAALETTSRAGDETSAGR